MESGKRVRIILVGGFHYSGVILQDTETHLKIKDKFGYEVLLLKSNIQVLEELHNGF
jgi:hypothetical protein